MIADVKLFSRSWQRRKELGLDAEPGDSGLDQSRVAKPAVNLPNVAQRLQEVLVPGPGSQKQRLYGRILDIDNSIQPDFILEERLRVRRANENQSIARVTATDLP